MSAEFAMPVAELGSSVMRHLRNATARFNGGEPVDCVFRNRQELATLGLAGIFARQPMLNCLAADVTHVEKGHAVEITSGAAVAPFYKVMQIEPVDLHTGWVTIQLEPAA